MIITEETTFEDYIQQITKYTGCIMMFFGFLGIVMLVFYASRFQQIYQIGLAFIYTYLIFLGFLIAVYNEKIFVKGYRT
jgi:hypothetical protein